MAFGANFKLKFCTYPILPFKYPNLIEAIIEDDSVEWTDEDLAKLTNGNIIRVFRDEHGVIKYFYVPSCIIIQSVKSGSNKCLSICREVEKVRDALSYEEPYQTWISEEELDGRTECSSVF